MAEIFMGLRASTDFLVEGQRPKVWREGILKQYPNGKAPLTALTALMKSERLTDPEFNWFQQELPDQAGEVAGIYSNAAGTTLNGDTNAADSILYVKISGTAGRHFAKHHVVLLRNNISADNDAHVRVEEAVHDSDSTMLQVRALTALTGVTSSNVSRALVIGTSYAEGASIGDSLTYDPTRLYNVTQIFRTPLEITRTAMETKLRTAASEYQRLKAEKLELHSIEMEKAFLYGTRSELMTDGKPVRTTMGLIQAIRQGGGLDKSFDGANWKTEGLEWLEDLLEQLFRYGATEKTAFVGSRAMLKINQLVREYGQWQYDTKTSSFGMNVHQLVTPFGTLNMKTHPLFSHEVSSQHSMVVFDPSQIKYRFITDTTYKSDQKNASWDSRDGIKEEYLTECGLEFHFPASWGFLQNIGGDSTTATSYSVPVSGDSDS